MKQTLVGKLGVITEGKLKGFKGTVVGFDSIHDEVLVELDDITCIQMSSKYINQEDRKIRYVHKDTSRQVEDPKHRLIVQYGVYLDGKLVCPYIDREDAEDAADFARMETGRDHEIREIRQASKLDD